MGKFYQIADYREADGAHPWLDAVINAQVPPPDYESEFILTVEADTALDALIETMVRASMLGRPPQRKHLFTISVYEVVDTSAHLPRYDGVDLALSPSQYVSLADKSAAVQRIWGVWRKSGFHVPKKRTSIKQNGG